MFKRKQSEEKIKAESFAEAMRLVRECKEKKLMPGATTQLVKSRMPPLWSRQEFDRWRIDVEKWIDNNESADKEK